MFTFKLEACRNGFLGPNTERQNASQQEEMLGVATLLDEFLCSDTQVGHIEQAFRARLSSSLQASASRPAHGKPSPVKVLLRSSPERQTVMGKVSR